MARYLNRSPLKLLSQFQPLPKRLVRSPKHREATREPVIKQLLIVSRDRQKLYELVKRTFSDNPTVEVILDRRSAEPRNANRANAPERRRGDRNLMLEIDNHLRTHGWAILRLNVFRSVGLPHRSTSR